MKSFLEMANMMWMLLINETRGLAYINIFIEIVIEEDVVNVELVDRPSSRESMILANCGGYDY